MRGIKLQAEAESFVTSVVVFMHATLLLQLPVEMRACWVAEVMVHGCASVVVVVVVVVVCVCVACACGVSAFVRVF